MDLRQLIANLWRDRVRIAGAAQPGALNIGRALRCATVAMALFAIGPTWGQSNPAAAPEVIYRTGFEFEEGYDPQFTLAGQNGWLSFGSGGNGLVTNFFEGFGQQAYVGFAPPQNNEDLLSVWRPIDLAPIPPDQTLITFSVLMQIDDSENGQFDDFRWSVYNTNEARLFTIDFDNAALLISYGLDDDKGFVATGLAFDNQGTYELKVTMNFARNLWSASLNDVVIVNSKPITTTGAALNLGDIDAVWAIRRPGSPGDNFMLFDNYTITGAPGDSIPPRLEQQRLEDGQFILWVFGEPGSNYAIEASTNLTDWQTIQVITAPSGGVFEVRDPAAADHGHRFYRARLQPGTPAN